VGTRWTVGLEERTIEEPLERRCEVCGATLTAQEISDALDSGGAFLCTVHAAEELPEVDEPPPPADA
jgi:hypothetical protein